MYGSRGKGGGGGGTVAFGGRSVDEVFDFGVCGVLAAGTEEVAE